MKELTEKENYKFKTEILEDINRLENYRLKNDKNDKKYLTTQT